MVVKRIFIMAGEASGDMLGAELMRALLTKQEGLEITFCGGPLMETATATQSLIPLEKLAMMGFVEVVKKLGQVRQNFQIVQQHLRNNPCDVVVLIDYPGFNMRLAKWLNRQGIRQEGTRVVQWVSPQVWAWKKGRVKALKSHCDLLVPILAFEQDFLMKHGVASRYMGHPMLDRIPQQAEVVTKAPILALAPGSRLQEFKSHMALFAETAALMGMEAMWIRPAHINAKAYRALLQQHAPKAPSHWAINEGMQHVQGCQLALVASGTATLECTLYGTAMVVAFRTHPINFLLAKALVKVPYIALVNLLLNKEVVKERIQGDCNPQQLAKDLQWLLDQPNHAQQLQQSLREVMGPAHAVNQLADHVLEA